MSGGGVKKFGWKRKVGEQISRSASAAFERETKNDDDVIESGDVDWLTLVPVNKKRVIGLEDNVTKAQRLIREGAMLAESERSVFIEISDPESNLFFYLSVILLKKKYFMISFLKLFAYCVNL